MKSPASINRMPARSTFLIVEFCATGCVMPIPFLSRKAAS